jgi:hypothetical protein
MVNTGQVDGGKLPMAVGRSGGKTKEPVLVGESFVTAAAAGRSTIDDLSCPPDRLRAPRAVLLFTGHLKGTCTSQRVWSANKRAWLTRRSPKIDVIVNQTRWCRETFGSGCHAFLHTWSTLDKAPVLLDVRAAWLNLSQRTLSRPMAGSRNGARTPSLLLRGMLTLTLTLTLSLTLTLTLTLTLALALALALTLTLTRRAHTALLGGVRRGDPRGGWRAPPHRSHRAAGAASAVRAGAAVGDDERDGRPEHAHAARRHRRRPRARGAARAVLRRARAHAGGRR